MFSGIVESVVKAKRIDRSNKALRISFEIPKGWVLHEGESISIDGVCTTIESIGGGNFSAYYMPETLRKTILTDINNSHLFNLERCLTLQSLIGGHLVSGHIDTIAVVSFIKREEDARVMKLRIDERFTRYIIYKGSIAVNGVSLTVIDVDENSFTISLIPYTLKNTNLGDLKVGDKVNIEVDLISKYLEKLKSTES